ncbi:hypothetical protein HY502_02885 [Candidatus Woesebacteria bacterium]|nr:hypothetical protein [Candidatus Woesebacteria bacterium]
MMEDTWGGSCGMVDGFGSFHFLFAFVTWGLLIALLVGLVRLVWKKGDKVK